LHRSIIGVPAAYIEHHPLFAERDRVLRVPGDQAADLLDGLVDLTRGGGGAESAQGGEDRCLARGRRRWERRSLILP
jgi:hypothetical protein